MKKIKKDGFTECGINGCKALLPVNDPGYQARISHNHANHSAEVVQAKAALDRDMPRRRGWAHD